MRLIDNTLKIAKQSDYTRVHKISTRTLKLAGHVIRENRTGLVIPMRLGDVIYNYYRVITKAPFEKSFFPNISAEGLYTPLFEKPKRKKIYICEFLNDGLTALECDPTANVVIVYELLRVGTARSIEEFYNLETVCVDYDLSEYYLKNGKAKTKELLKDYKTDIHVLP